MSEIEKIKEYKSSNGVLYRTSCECLDPRHALTFEVDDTLAAVTFYNTACTWTDDGNIFTNIFKRIKLALEILFIGTLYYESDFMFRGPNQIKALIGILEEMVKRLDDKDTYRRYTEK